MLLYASNKIYSCVTDYFFHKKSSVSRAFFSCLTDTCKNTVYYDLYFIGLPSASCDTVQISTSTQI